MKFRNIIYKSSIPFRTSVQNGKLTIVIFRYSDSKYKSPKTLSLRMYITADKINVFQFRCFKFINQINYYTELSYYILQLYIIL